jgi:hypothetical protein
MRRQMMIWTWGRRRRRRTHPAPCASEGPGWLRLQGGGRGGPGLRCFGRVAVLSAPACWEAVRGCWKAQTAGLLEPSGWQGWGGGWPSGARCRPPLPPLRARRPQRPKQRQRGGGRRAAAGAREAPPQAHDAGDGAGGQRGGRQRRWGCPRCRPGHGSHPAAPLGVSCTNRAGRGPARGANRPAP